MPRSSLKISTPQLKHKYMATTLATTDNVAQLQPIQEREKLTKKQPKDLEYGILDSRNIERVSFGDYNFNTWYGNSAYFLASGDLELGTDTLAKQAGVKRRLSTPQASTYWLPTLHVCEFCFKYSADHNNMTLHRTVCSLAKLFPPIGKLMYADTKTPYVIKKVRGFRHELFCQNLALFSKLFLDDKSVYYNVKAFDFYILYGHDQHDTEVPGSILRKRLRPMGFFSKEVNAWESDNNLACICVFPPYQRLGLGSLLIEFLYALAAVTPGQTWLGPEFPLSPYGKITYLRYWSKKLAFILANDFKSRRLFTLAELASHTGFRKDDILFTLEYMEVLEEDPDHDEIFFSALNLTQWCKRNHYDPYLQASTLNPLCLLI